MISNLYYILRRCGELNKINLKKDLNHGFFCDILRVLQRMYSSLDHIFSFRLILFIIMSVCMWLQIGVVTIVSVVHMWLAGTFQELVLPFYLVPMIKYLQGKCFYEMNHLPGQKHKFQFLKGTVLNKFEDLQRGC